MLVSSKCNWKPHQGILEALRQHSYLSSFFIFFDSNISCFIFLRSGFPNFAKWLSYWFPDMRVPKINSLSAKWSFFWSFWAFFLLTDLTCDARPKNNAKEEPWCFPLKQKLDIESTLWSKYCFFLNSLGLCGVDLLDKIKAFLDHLWKMASFVSDDAIADKSHHYCSNLK